jgi:hypothetical protein
VSAPPEADSGGCAMSPRSRLPAFFAAGLALAAIALLRRRPRSSAR